MPLTIQTPEGPARNAVAGECELCETRIRSAGGVAYELVTRDDYAGWERHECDGKQLTVHGL